MASGAPATEPVVVEMVSKDATSDADEMSITESKIRAKIAEMRDMLEGGRVMSVARDPETAYGQSNLAFKDLSFSIEVGTKVKTNQVILTPSSGAYAAGSMVAIMGPSGCGKTTLLDMLAGKKTAPYTGEVFLNGKPRDRLFPRVTSYVAQHDVMPPYCTVAEAIEFNHRLRVDSGRVGNQLRWMFVDEALTMFGLETVRDSIIGDERVRGISGGQKRRVTLARGFVGGSQIVFCDEPTSGLSATDAEVCVRAMCAASRKQGVTFVVVIHQPRVEVVAMFSHLTLITSNPGRIVYNGAFADAAEYFAAAGSPVPANCNPADFLLDVITPGVVGNRSDELADRYRDGQACEVDTAVAASVSAGGKSPLEVLREMQEKRSKLFGHVEIKDSVYSVSLCTQIATLFKRRMTLTRRDKNLLRVRFGMSTMQGLIVGVAFMDIGKKLPVQQLSFLFMLLQMGALSNMVVMPEMIAQRLVFKFETSDALYGTTAAVLVDTAVNNTLAVAANFITSIIMYALSGLEWSDFGLLYFWSLLCFVTMINYFKIIAAVAPAAAQALQVAMPGLMLIILFNNFFVNHATAPAFMRWALYVSPMAWTIEQIITGIHGADPDLVQLYGYDSSDAQTATAVTVLVVELILFQLISLVCLRYFNNPKR